MIHGGIQFSELGAARHLLAGSKDFFKSLRHQIDGDGEEGLQADDDYEEDWAGEQKRVFMFSGCKDEQTSADAFIGMKHVVSIVAN